MKIFAPHDCMSECLSICWYHDTVWIFKIPAKMSASHRQLRPRISSPMKRCPGFDDIIIRTCSAKFQFVAMYQCINKFSLPIGYRYFRLSFE